MKVGYFFKRAKVLERVVVNKDNYKLRGYKS